jgi:hypothetical protein
VKQFWLQFKPANTQKPSLENTGVPCRGVAMIRIGLDITLQANELLNPQVSNLVAVAKVVTSVVTRTLEQDCQPNAIPTQFTSNARSQGSQKARIDR